MFRRWFLLGFLLLVFGGLVKAEILQLAWPPLSFQAPASAESAEVVFITAEALKKRLDLGEEILVGDVRRKASFDKLHLAGALSLPMDDHPRWAPTLAKDVPLVLYCACEGDESSARAAREIRTRYRHEQVMVLQGGLGSWVDAGYPIVEKKPPASLPKVKLQ
jgi:rhodanese-related sulfurtransferase